LNPSILALALALALKSPLAKLCNLALDTGYLVLSPILISIALFFSSNIFSAVCLNNSVIFDSEYLLKYYYFNLKLKYKTAKLLTC
jgi:hypothetical protein